MENAVLRAFAHLRDSGRRRREAQRLANLPDYLLYDMGLTPGGEASLARQIRPEYLR